MKLKIKLTLAERFGRAVSSLEPDNTPNIITSSSEGRITVKFTFDRIASAIASLDDYLSNLRIATEIEELGEE